MEEQGRGKLLHWNIYLLITLELLHYLVFHTGTSARDNIRHCAVTASMQARPAERVKTQLDITHSLQSFTNVFCTIKGNL